MGFPTELDGAKVIHITSNSITNQFGTIGVINDNKELVDKLLITAVAICQYEGSKDIYLFSCNIDWEVIQDTDYDSMEEAKKSARLYKNVRAEDWMF